MYATGKDFLIYQGLDNVSNSGKRISNIVLRSIN